MHLNTITVAFTYQLIRPKYYTGTFVSRSSILICEMLYYENETYENEMQKM